MDHDEFQESEYRWRQLQKDDYVFDKMTGTLIVNVSPCEVLLLDRITNYQDNADQFDLASITISGSNDSIQFEGEQARTQFKKESQTRTSFASGNIPIPDELKLSITNNKSIFH